MLKYIIVRTSLLLWTTYRNPQTIFQVWRWSLLQDKQQENIIQQWSQEKKRHNLEAHLLPLDLETVLYSGREIIPKFIQVWGVSLFFSDYDKYECNKNNSDN